MGKRVARRVRDHHEAQSEYYKDWEHEATPQGLVSKVNQTPLLARRSTDRSHSGRAVALVWVPNY